MGSDSDLPTMKDAADVLIEFGVPFEITIVSAHRTPERMYAYAQDAAARGLAVLIAGAGGAAHLPGMVAALTPLPVVGVPIKSSHLSGLDSLYSIVQMPKGVPVATVAIGNAANAGLLAVRMLAIGDAALMAKLIEVYKGGGRGVLVVCVNLRRGGARVLSSWTAVLRAAGSLGHSTTQRRRRRCWTRLRAWRPRWAARRPPRSWRPSTESSSPAGSRAWPVSLQRPTRPRFV